MQAIHPGTGMAIEFPDNTPPEEIDRHFQTAQNNMPVNATSIAQQFIDGARGAYEQQQMAPAPVNGAGFVGLDPQQAQFMLQQRQNAAALQQRAASDQARNRIQQQQLVQQEMEGEKDRAQQIKLYKERLRNEREIAKANAEVDKFEAEMREAGKQDDRQFRTKLEQMRHDAKMLQAQDKRFNVGGNLVDASGNVIFSAPEGSGGADKIIGRDTIMMENPETGKTEPVRVNVFADGSYGVLGPAPSTTSTPRPNPDDFELFEKASRYADARMEAQETSVIEPGDPNYKTHQEHMDDYTKRWEAFRGKGQAIQPTASTAKPSLVDAAAAKTYQETTGKELKWSPTKGAYVELEQ